MGTMTIRPRPSPRFAGPSPPANCADLLMNRAAASMALPNGDCHQVPRPSPEGSLASPEAPPSPAGFFYRPPFSSVSLFGAAIFWTSLNPAALRRDEQAFDDR